MSASGGAVTSPSTSTPTGYTALLDACVLVPITLADTLLRVAEGELYRPLWSSRILGEATDAILEIHPDLAPDRVAKRFAAMNDTFEDASVEGWEVLEATVVLPDANDRHVVAAAMRGEADAIVTANVRDFPGDVLARVGLREAAHSCKQRRGEEIALDLLATPDVAPNPDLLKLGHD